MPNFTPTEQYIVHSLKVDSAARGASAAAGYLTACIVMAAIAVYQSNHLLMTLAFVILCLFRIYEVYAQWQWHPHFRSVIEKYEAAIGGENPAVPRDSSDAVVL